MARCGRQQGGAQPALLAGHSLGEYTALVAAGALSLHDAAHLVRIRGQLMQDAAPAGIGAMAAVLGAEDALVADVCARGFGQRRSWCPANYNSPGQIVIGGHAAAVDRAIALLAERGVRKAVKLAVSVPSHTPLMREAANRLAEAMARHAVAARRDSGRAERRCAKCTTASHAIRDALVRQLYLPVQWTDCVQALAARGATRIAECGPGKVLTGLVKRIDKSLEARALGTPGEFEAALRQNAKPAHEPTRDDRLTSSGEIALVTGASRGIGAAIADELAAQGATVIGTATSDPARRRSANASPRTAAHGRVLERHRRRPRSKR